MGYVLGLAAVLLVAMGYFFGARRTRSGQDALKAALDERDNRLALLENELHRRLSLDPVTEVPNQQYFQDFLEREWRRASRDRSVVSLAMIEVDHFRAYHERVGKPESDACLRAICDVMKPLIHRPSDLLARYGGAGKFGLVLGGTDGQGASVLADRLRRAVEELKKPNPASPSGSPMTLSVGIGSLMPDREGAWQDIELIAMAERALSQAHEAGRNMVSLEDKNLKVKG